MIFIALILIISMLSFNTVFALTCEDYNPDECPGYDDDWYKCTSKYVGSKYSCTFADDSEQSCYAFNGPRYYGSDGMPDLSKCPTDRCTTDAYVGYCLDKIDSGKKYSCENFGYWTNIYGTDLCSNDEWGNPCATPEGFNGLCYTAEYIYTGDNTTDCEDFSETECGTVKSDFGDTCSWNSLTNKCEIEISQTEINRTATSETILGGKAARILMEHKNSVTSVEKPFVCSDVKYLTGAWLLLRISGPFIIILFGSLDFFKSMVAGDEKKMKESRGKFIKRLIAFGLFIILPFVVQFVFSVMGTYGSENVCLVKCIVTNDTSEKGCE